MHIELDVHTHTVASGHAFSTLQEMVYAAAGRGLKLLGITEHAPSVPGTCPEVYFRNLHMVPRLMYGVELMLGAEINILDTVGNMDMSEALMQKLDIRIASIHSALYSGGDKSQNTEAVMRVIRNPLINIIGHPADGASELDFEPLVLAAKENHTLLEINNSSLNPVRNKVKAVENSLELLRLCKKHHAPIILGSDAHISFDIAKYNHIYPLLKQVGFHEELIINTSLVRFKTYLKL
ncbi:MAG: phosphatase [Paramuribaculum sp.]|nr:phosphatase [Paramuribaculum sp.]